MQLLFTNFETIILLYNAIACFYAYFIGRDRIRSCMRKKTALKSMSVSYICNQLIKTTNNHLKTIIDSRL